jgi:hypothetical protein
VSQPSTGLPPFRVVYSERCREQTRHLLTRAAAQGRFTEIAHVVREINTRLEWIPLDFGDPLHDLVHLGLREHVGVLPPLVVTYAVDEARRIVYVSVPFKVLPRAGL